MGFLVKAYIGLGTNTGDRKKNILRALDLLQNHFEITNKSSIYETEPIGYMYNDWFFNSVIEIDTSLQPQELLEKLHIIENSFGRNRTIKYGPISLDLDLLFYGDKIIERFDLHVPHSKIPDRRFVLLPMAEIAPDFVHPITNSTMKDMLNSISKDKSVKKTRIKLD